MKNILIILITIGLYACQSDDYVAFKPLTKNKDEGLGPRDKVDTYQEGDPNLDKASLNNIVHVLEYYKEGYKIQDNSIMIPKELSDNQELLYNYTLKSKDQEWLENHKVQ